MKLTPKNWGAFQHYKTRRPPWIKLYRTLLDDPDFMRLPVASKALAPCLWLLASEYDNGTIDQSYDGVAYRLRVTDNELAIALKPLIDRGFFSVEGEDASTMLARCLQDACSEREERESRETPSVSPPAGEKKTKPVSERKAPGTRLPEKWTHQIAHETLAEKLGLDFYDELDKFKDYFWAEGKVKANWNRTFNNWLRTAAERKQQQKSWRR